MFAVARHSLAAASRRAAAASSARCLSTTTAAADDVAFIGLGNMGAHMARNLIKAGHSVTVFDIVPEAVKDLEASGAKSAATAGAAAVGADVVITMLPTSPHVVDVYTSEGGVLDNAKEGSLLLDCSTIAPGVSREVAAKAADAKCRMADAPVSGGVGGAEAGTLTFMVGASDEIFADSKPILDCMGANIVHCGDIGTGQVAKLCNNLVLGISMSAVCEAMNMGKKLGIDSKVLAGILNTSSGRCWSSDTYNPVPGVMENVPSSRGYTGGFGVSLMRKDLMLATEAAQSVGAKLPTGDQAFALYDEMTNNPDYTGKDFSSVYDYLGGNDE